MKFVHGGAVKYEVSCIDPHLYGQSLLSSCTYFLAFRHLPVQIPVVLVQVAEIEIARKVRGIYCLHILLPLATPLYQVTRTKVQYKLQVCAV